MKRVIDFSWFQSGAGGIRPNPEGYRVSADAYQIRWCDWAVFTDPDPFYIEDAENILSQNIPVGPYLYPRPGSASVETQMNTWFAATPWQPTFSPMLDLESSRIAGGALQQWVETALDMMAQHWQMKPTLYVGPNDVLEWGLPMPRGDYWLQVAQYPFTNRNFLWTEQANWFNIANSVFGGPDLPWGRPYDLWQYTSQAFSPAFNNRHDVSVITDEAYFGSLRDFEETVTPEQAAEILARLASIEAAINTGTLSAQIVPELEKRAAILLKAIQTVEAKLQTHAVEVEPIANAVLAEIKEQWAK